MRGTNNSNVLEPTFGCEGTNLMIRDMKEQNHMIGTKTKICWNKKLRNKNLRNKTT
jgi:hypothetical protein